MVVTNTLAFYNMATVTATKSFIVPTLGVLLQFTTVLRCGPSTRIRIIKSPYLFHNNKPLPYKRMAFRDWQVALQVPSQGPFRALEYV